jgi:hypothetical protein
MSNTNSKNIIITDATFYWSKLDKAVSPFGTPVYEVSVHLDNGDRQITELRMEGINFKDDVEKGTVYFTAKRKAEKADGSPNTKVVVVDTNKKPVDASKIGNGTKGKVKLFKYDWEHGKKKGSSIVLMALQVTELVEYKKASTIVDIFEADDGLGGTVKVPAGAGVKGTLDSDDF